jgi:hypothetical protein
VMGQVLLLHFGSGVRIPLQSEGFG